MRWACYLLHALLLPPLVVGWLRWCRARLQNRLGPSVLQPYYDLWRLMNKSETVSNVATGVFRAAPAVRLAALLAIALMLPWVGLASPLDGDLVLVVYLLALARFAMGLAALDTGSAFGALGSSRTSTLSLQVEPALLLALGAVAARAHSTSLSQMFAPAALSSVDLEILPLVMIAAWLALMADMARMPIDDPTTHLELTMIHEALILENSGRNLALVEVGVGLELTMLGGLVAQILLLALGPLSVATSYGLSLLLIFLAASVVALAEATLVKLRWRRIPHLMSFAVVSGMLACLLLALEGH